MKIRKLLLLAFILFNFFLNAQIKAVISNSTYTIETVDLTINNVTVVLSGEGEIQRFYSDNSNGATDYYDQDVFNKHRAGKIKSLGGVKVEYWNAMNQDDPKYGKIKSIGDLKVDYWDSIHFDPEKAGKVKSIGNITIDYYPKDIIDNSRFGKLKSIGNISIDYGLKDIIDRSKFKKLVKFGSVKLDYWNDSIIEKEKFGRLKSVEGNSKEVSVSVL